VIDTPLSEGGIIGTAIGMALYGLRPVPEIQFSDFIFPAFDQIVSELAKFRYRSGGEYPAKMVIRTPVGGGIRGWHYHSQSPEAKVVRPGAHVTVIAWGAMLYEAIEAANQAAGQGIDCEVLDLRTLWPVDIEAIVTSVKKTGRVVVVHEAPKTCGFGAEIVAL